MLLDNLTKIFKNTKLVFGTIVLLAFFLRIVVLIAAPAQYQTFGDTDEYLEVAGRFCAAWSYPFEHIALPTFRAPGFPFLLALVSGCFSLPLGWIRASLLVLDSLSCLLGMQIVYGLSADRKCARAAVFGIAFACYPLFLQESITVQSEVLTLFAIFAALLLVSKNYTAATNRTMLYAIASGFFIAIGILTRPSAMILFVPLFIGLVFKRYGNRLINSAIIAGTLMFLLPWSIYATSHTGKVTIVNDSFCYSMYRGARLELIDVYTATDRESFDKASALSEAVLREVERSIPDNKWCSSAIELLETHPAEEVRLALLKLWAYFRPWPHPGAHSNVIVIVVGSTVIALYALFVIFLLQRSRSEQVRAIKVLAVVYIVLVALLHVPHQVSNRYRVPFVDPLIMLLAAAHLRLPDKRQS